MKRSNIFLALFWMFLVSSLLLFWDSILHPVARVEFWVSVAFLVLAAASYWLMMRALIREEKKEGRL